MQDQDAVKVIGNCTLLTNGLQFAGVVPFDEWQKRGQEINTVINVYNSHIQWWLGDWIIYGERHYKDKYSQALDSTMYALGTLRNCVWVCRNVKLENRNQNLSFQHHYEVAALPYDEQKEWLSRAEVNKWNSKQLRMAIKGMAKEESIEKVEDTPEDITNNAISHTKPGMSFMEWWSAEEHGLKLLSAKEAAYAGWMAGTLSRAKRAE